MFHSFLDKTRVVYVPPYRPSVYLKGNLFINFVRFNDDDILLTENDFDFNATR